MSDLEGRCLCGAIRFAVSPPTLFVAHCHCRYCREAHGAAFVTWVGAAEERFRILPGSAQPKWFQSSQQSRRGFCPDCGTTLFYASTVCPGEIHVARPAFQGRSTASRSATSFTTSMPTGLRLATRCHATRARMPGLAKFKAVRR